jgi:hypothetical protein
VQILFYAAVCDLPLAGIIRVNPRRPLVHKSGELYQSRMLLHDYRALVLPLKGWKQAQPGIVRPPYNFHTYGPIRKALLLFRYCLVHSS